MCDCYKATILIHSSLINEPHADDCEDIAGTESESVDFDALYKWFGNGDTQDECYHEMREYIGFTETYKYCTKCDMKEK